MKVKDLIEKLQDCNPDAEVSIGYNNTYTDTVKHIIAIEPTNEIHNEAVVYIFNYWWDEGIRTN